MRRLSRSAMTRYAVDDVVRYVALKPLPVSCKQHGTQGRNRLANGNVPTPLLADDESMAWKITKGEPTNQW